MNLIGVRLTKDNIDNIIKNGFTYAACGDWVLGEDTRVNSDGLAAFYDDKLFQVFINGTWYETKVDDKGNHRWRYFNAVPVQLDVLKNVYKVDIDKLMNLDYKELFPRNVVAKDILNK